MARCAGFKRDGGQCTATVEPPQRYCWWHDPANAEQRRRAASKAARSKPNREVASVKGQLQDLADRVLAGTIDRADASVIGQLLNIKLRALEAERKMRETEELERRLEELERLADGHEGRRSPWGYTTG